MVVSAELIRALAPRHLARRVAFTSTAPTWLRRPGCAAEDADCGPGAVLAPLAAAGGRIAAGKARHAAEIALAHGMVDGEHRSPDGLPLAYPMLSLPIVEMALRTPTDALIDAQRDRIAFRDAMAGVLPSAVTGRQQKGDYTGMYQLGLRRNFAIAKELIADGFAARAGILDLPSALADLRASALGHGRHLWPLQNLLAVEAWCRAWS
jgi:asparagine synthase (glutamine-hydrolysing)